MSIRVERGPLRWRRVTTVTTATAGTVEYLLAAMRADLDPGPVELYVEVRPTLLVLTMSEARHLDVPDPPPPPPQPAPVKVPPGQAKK